jgi:hypothetical protein
MCGLYIAICVWAIRAIFILNLSDMKLFMVLIGCKPKGRFTEQHDVFLGIGESLKELLPAMNSFWPEAEGKLHIDAWREVTVVGDHQIVVTDRANASEDRSSRLFFINLGGYKPGDFEEYHYKMLIAATDKATAIRESKATAFYQHTGFKGAESHIDDKYGIDVDDFYEIEEMLPTDIRENYALELTRAEGLPADEWHIGYVNVSKW